MDKRLWTLTITPELELPQTAATNLKAHNLTSCLRT